MGEWISVKDSLPEHFVSVLVWEKYSASPFVGFFSHTGEWSVVLEHCDTSGDAIPTSKVESSCVTHWMELPASPGASNQIGGGDERS